MLEPHADHRHPRKPPRPVAGRTCARPARRSASASQVELLGMTTRGDQILDRTLSKVGGKGLFVKELETALEEGRAAPGRALAEGRADGPAGRLRAGRGARARGPARRLRLAALRSAGRAAAGRLVGTSSLRRVVQLGALRPDLRIEPLRGNLDTRLRKLDEGQYDAIVLAAAGLKRLGLAERIRSVFEPDADAARRRPGRAGHRGARRRRRAARSAGRR